MKKTKKGKKGSKFNAKAYKKMHGKVFGTNMAKDKAEQAGKL